ncbi:MAG: ATP-grasp domain-containing protein [Deltaproteobacteria bacterium]|nr:ATP-grasp domain-containing protein [Deltaproteobacteria bacterium]
MRVALLFGAVPEEAPADELDVLREVELAEETLRRLGHETARVPLSLRLDEGARALTGFSPDVVVNLVETLEGKGDLAHFAPALLDRLRLPYTGAPTQALFLTSDKVLAKRWLVAAGLPTPAWATERELAAGARIPTPAIIKPVSEDASVGIDETSVVSRGDRVWAETRARTLRLGSECFAERYIEGREFNLSLLETADGPQVLPPAEIRFAGYPAEKPRMVCYRAKWDAASFEYRNTPRSFDFPASDRALLERLASMATACWRHFGLAGYARVDFRVDRSGEPWVLEINANPCISPESGFVAAAARAGYGYPELLSRFLEVALRRVARPPQNGACASLDTQTGCV